MSVCIHIASILVACIWLLSVDWDKKTIKYTCFGMATMAAAALFALGMVKMITLPWQDTGKPYATEKIVTLADNNMISGRVYIRRGYFDENLWYQYMVALDDGGFVANKLNSTDTTLYYSEDNFRVEWYKKTKKWLWFEDEKYYHKIFIPKGSISDEFTVDFK